MNSYTLYKQEYVVHTPISNFSKVHPFFHIRTEFILL